MRQIMWKPLVCSVILMGCGGGGGGDGGGGPALVFTSLAITPPNPTLPVNGTVTLVATPKNQNGGDMAGLPAATFSSNNTAVASVTSPAGVVTAHTSGTADITASLTSGGITKTATARVTVNAVGLTATVGNVGNAWSPDRVDIARTGTVTFSISNGPHNVTFGPKAGAPTDVPNCTNCSADRQFNTVDAQTGFAYQCTLHAGMNGVVYVH